MVKSKKWNLSFLFFSTWIVGISHAESFDIDFSARARWESIDIDGESADASTIKSRAGVHYNLSENLKAFLQVDSVVSLNQGRHSDGVDQSSDPTIADPAGTELNQANLMFRWQGGEAILGRQRMVLGDHRFIGDVGFRQNDQTYDALLLKYSMLSASQLSVAYIRNVHRIFGDRAGQRLSKDDRRFSELDGVRPSALLGNHRVDGVLIDARIREWDHIELSSYGYDIYNYDHAAFSNTTVGAEGQYRKKVAEIKLSAAVELAVQNQPDQKTTGIPYHKVSTSLQYKKVQMGLRHEQLSQKNGVAFITPLATVHKFQGWADQFLLTPSVGLIDNSISVKWRSRPWTVDARYHWFKSQRSSFAIAEEADVDFIFSPNRKHEFKIRIADFKPSKGQSIKTDSVKKLFVMYAYNM